MQEKPRDLASLSSTTYSFNETTSMVYHQPGAYLPICNHRSSLPAKQSNTAHSGFLALHATLEDLRAPLSQIVDGFGGVTCVIGGREGCETSAQG